MGEFMKINIGDKVKLNELGIKALTDKSTDRAKHSIVNAIAKEFGAVAALSLSSNLFVIEFGTATFYLSAEMIDKAEPPQGHPHAELMAQYAEDAKTNAEPWRLWEIGDTNGDWWGMTEGSGFVSRLRYRRKPKVKIIHGVEVPDITIKPSVGDDIYVPATCFDGLVSNPKYYDDRHGRHHVDMDICYPYTEEGKQAAILHAKAMLGIGGEL